MYTSLQKVPLVRTPVVSVLLLVAAVHARPLPAQEAPSLDGLEEGHRIRITAPALGLDETPALFASADAEWVRVDVGGRTGRVAVPRDQVRSVQVSAGQGSRVWLGGLLGAAVGVGVAALISGDERDDPGCRSDGGSWSGIDPCLLHSGRSAEEKRSSTLGSGLAAGALLGVLVGRAITFERWRSVDVVGRPVVLLPLLGSGPAGVGARIAF